MKRYDNYKDSGIEWIGELPSHWKNTRIKFTVNEKNSLFIDGDWIESKVITEEGIRYITTGNVKVGYYSEQGNGYISNQTFTDLNCTEVFEGDLILSRLNNPIGRACIVPNLNSRIVTSVDNVIYRPDSNLSKRYLLYLFSSKEYFEHTDLISRGATMQRISRGMLGNLKIPLPEIEEQTAIANYLDQKTSHIDDLIAKKERLIQLLEEERTAIINKAVTKGLDPSVPMKDSGIEWLGEIPAHWEVKRMRYLSDITTGGKDTENREDDGIYPFYVRSQTVERISTYSFDGEAILTAGDGVGVCKVWHYVNEKFDFHQRVYMLCNFRAVLGKYLFYYLKENFGKEVMKLSAKSTVDSLRRPMFQNFLVCFGTIEEQNEIILKIEKEEQRIQTIIAKTQQEIELLKEYKTALISEVVTGKVDVRDEKLN